MYKDEFRKEGEKATIIYLKSHLLFTKIQKLDL